MVEHEKKILERTKELQELSKAAETIKRSATTAVQNSEKVFNELIGSIQQRRIAMTNLIRAHEKADLGRVNAFFKQVSYEITALKEKYADLEQLLQTTDLTTFLETSKKTYQPLGSESLSRVSINTNSMYIKMKESVQKLRQSMESMLQVEFAKMTVQPDSAIVSPEPLIRQDFLKYASPIALDVNTAYRHLKLSDGNKQVAWTDESQNYPDLPQRFTYCKLVLGKDCLSPPSYWEVEWTGEK
ncbi:tripartite motif-containing protein 16-like, partial [Engraulis encrasicolus]|uniref:tripartite motif-containing protein 16-like n=1 Tax=Engraulis encrasicolus TaxID=184585 RepID=UPI002FD25650